jgi:hypothetical protein
MKCLICNSEFDLSESIRKYGNNPSENNCCSPKCYTEHITKLPNLQTSIVRLSNKELIELSKECNKPTWSEDNILRKFVIKHFGTDKNMIITVLSLVNSFLIEITERFEDIIVENAEKD